VRALARVATCGVLVVSCTAVNWSAQAADPRTESPALAKPDASESIQVRSDEGWLPDPVWGPWYRFTDPSGNNPDSGRGPLEYTPGRFGMDDEGRIIVAGLRYDQTRGTACDLNTGWKRRLGEQNIAITRYLPDGTVDASFGTDGTFVVPHSTHRVEFTDLVVSGNSIYISGVTDNISCGPMPRGLATPSIVVKVTEAGRMDRTFGQEGVWEASDTAYEEVTLSDLGSGAVSAFYKGRFVALGASGVEVTDLTEELCLPYDWNDPGSVADCPQGRLEGLGGDVGGLLTYGFAGNVEGSENESVAVHPDSQVLRAFFGTLSDSALVPNLDAGPQGVVSSDLARLLGNKQLVATGWTAWDSRGRLVVAAPASELYPVLVTDPPPYGQYLMDMPHARGVVSARFARSDSGGFALDTSYGDQGASYTPLPFSGGDSFWFSAISLDSDDRLVLVAQQWNSETYLGGQFAIRLTSEGTLDPEYAEGGMLWLPGGTPYLYGKAALDSRDNQYFATAWGEFASRKKRAAPFQLGRLTTRGVVQVHNGFRWIRSKKKAPMSSSVRMLTDLPATARKGQEVTVKVRVLANASGDPFARAAKPVARADVTLNLMGAPGKPTFFPVASGRTNKNGVVRLTFRATWSGHYSVTAKAKDRIVDAGTPPTKVVVRRR
jgi:uncharacterized delta-60 repeat protein